MAGRCTTLLSYIVFYCCVRLSLLNQIGSNKFGLKLKPGIKPDIQSAFNYNVPLPTLQQVTTAPTNVRPETPVVMDYSVPAFPLLGEDMVLTCGYLHQENLRFKSLQWSRRKEHVENLFFYYTDSRAHVYTIPGDHWLNRSHISYMVEDRETHLVSP